MITVQTAIKVALRPSRSVTTTVLHEALANRCITERRWTAYDDEGPPAGPLHSDHRKRPFSSAGTGPTIGAVINWKRATFGIRAVGLSVGEGFTADDRWAIVEDPYEHLFMPIPLSAGGQYEPNTEHVSLAQTLFFADCLAFDHDCPATVLPYRSDTPPPYEAIGHWRPWQEPGRYYREVLESAIEHAHTLRYTDGLTLRYAVEGDPLTRFEDRFEGRQEALSLYTAAIRQVDFLSEYLGLYRVLEWSGKDNGKKFTQANLDGLRDYDFGSLRMVDLDHPLGRPPNQAEEPIDVFDTLRERALGRIEALRTADIDVPAHLYALRNGLAHGKQDLILNDLGPSVDAVAADLPVVKLLARMAVEKGR
ncbi:methylamine utilization protein MauJ [Streptomyces anulatus]